MKVYLNIIILILLIGVVSAENLGTFKQNDCIQLYQLCDDCTYVNITSVKYPNSTILFLNQAMTKTGVDYNYTFCQTSDLGDYSYKVCGDKNTFTCEDIGFEITYTGKEFTSQQTYVYIISLIFLVLLIIGVAFIINKLPSKDTTTEDNLVMSINYLKHLRNVLWVLIWGISLACVFIISNLGIAYLDNKMIADLFWALFTIMFWITIVGVPVYFVWIFYRIFQDKEFQKMIERGVDIKSTP